MKARVKHNTFLALSIAALLPAGSAMAATASGGTVNFSGKVVTSACAISAGSANIDVDLGEVRTATLAAAGSEASTAKAFAITLEDCEIADTSASTEANPIAATTVSVTFTGTPDSTDANSLAAGANGSTTSAQGYNDAVHSQFDQKNGVGIPATQVQSLPLVTVGGIKYLQLSVDFGSASGATISEVKVWTNSVSTINQSTFSGLSTALGATMYDLGSNTINVSNVPSGSGNANLVIDIPYSLFPADHSQYVYVWTNWTNISGGGFIEVAVHAILDASRHTDIAGPHTRTELGARRAGIPIN